MPAYGIMIIYFVFCEGAVATRSNRCDELAPREGACLFCFALFWFRSDPIARVRLKRKLLTWRFMATRLEQDTEEEEERLAETQKKISRGTMCVAKSLDGRLLCASECAYEIENPYFQGVGYLAGTTAKRISQGVNSCLVGRTIDGIVVAFRGTQAGNMLEWLQNAAVFLQTVKSVPGSIHAGFYQAVKNMYEPVKQSILQMMKDSLSYRPKKIYLTGHSKGGSMASLTAVMMQQDHEIPNAHYVCSFGASRVGDSAFRTHFNRTINQTTYENSLDIVPFLPPGHETIEDMNQTMTDKMDEILWSKGEASKARCYFWRYQPIGNRRYIDENGKIVKHVSKELDHQRIKDIETKTCLSYAEFRRAHCPCCPDNDPKGTCSGGYFCAIAPEICLESKLAANN